MDCWVIFGTHGDTLEKAREQANTDEVIVTITGPGEPDVHNKVSSTVLRSQRRTTAQEDTLEKAREQANTDGVILTTTGEPVVHNKVSSILFGSQRRTTTQEDTLGKAREETNTNEVIVNTTEEPDVHNNVSSQFLWSQKRKHYPGDSDDKGYESELDVVDSEELTHRRRNIKDDLERALRAIDLEVPEHYKGDDEFIELFTNYLRKRSGSEFDVSTSLSNEDSPTNNAYDKSTVGLYANAFRNYVLKSCHRKVEQLSALDFLDCETEKPCSIQGKTREGDREWKCQPFTLTVDIVIDALNNCKATKGSSAIRGTIVSATRQAMNFIELYFTERLNLYGPKPLETVRFAHNTIQTYIEGENIWNGITKECKNVALTNKKVDNILDPNKEANVVKAINEYLASKKREENIDKVLKVQDYSRKPSEFTEAGKIVMGEGVAVTGM